MEELNTGFGTCPVFSVSQISNGLENPNWRIWGKINYISFGLPSVFLFVSLFFSCGSRIAVQIILVKVIKMTFSSQERRKRRRQEAETWRFFLFFFF